MRWVGWQRVTPGLTVRIVLVRGKRRLRAPTTAMQARRHARLVDGRRLPLQPGKLVADRYAVLVVPSFGRHVRLGIPASPRGVHLLRKKKPLVRPRFIAYYYFADVLPTLYFDTHRKTERCFHTHSFMSNIMVIITILSHKYNDCVQKQWQSKR